LQILEHYQPNLFRVKQPPHASDHRILVPLYVDFYEADLRCNRLLLQEVVQGDAADSSLWDLRFKSDYSSIATAPPASIFKFDGALNVGNRQLMNFER